MQCAASHQPSFQTCDYSQAAWGDQQEYYEYGYAPLEAGSASKKQRCGTGADGWGAAEQQLLLQYGGGVPFQQEHHWEAAASQCSWMLQPPHILNTRTHPLSEFESAVLYQAQKQYGNRWTLISSQFMPWRSPGDLRTACHTKTREQWNKYVKTGFSMELLLANRPPDYQAHWEAFTAHMQAAAVQMQHGMFLPAPQHSSPPQAPRTRSRSNKRRSAAGSGGSKHLSSSRSSSPPEWHALQQQLPQLQLQQLQEHRGAASSKTNYTVTLQATQLAVADLGKRISSTQGGGGVQGASDAAASWAPLPCLAPDGSYAAAAAYGYAGGVGAGAAAGQVSMPAQLQPLGYCDWSSTAQAQAQDGWFAAPAPAATWDAAANNTSACGAVSAAMQCATVAPAPAAAPAAAAAAAAAANDDDPFSFLDSLSELDVPEWAAEAAEQAAEAAVAGAQQEAAACAVGGVLSCSAAMNDSTQGPEGACVPHPGAMQALGSFMPAQLQAATGYGCCNVPSSQGLAPLACYSTFGCGEPSAGASLAMPAAAAGEPLAHAVSCRSTGSGGTTLHASAGSQGNLLLESPPAAAATAGIEATTITAAAQQELSVLLHSDSLGSCTLALGTAGSPCGLAATAVAGSPVCNAGDLTGRAASAQPQPHMPAAAGASASEQSPPAAPAAPAAPGCWQVRHQARTLHQPLGCEPGAAPASNLGSLWDQLEAEHERHDKLQPPPPQAGAWSSCCKTTYEAHAGVDLVVPATQASSSRVGQAAAAAAAWV